MRSTNQSTHKNTLAIEALRKQIQVIAFEANLYDLGISNGVPYHEHCSTRRRKLNAEIMRLGGIPKPLPFGKTIIKIDEVVRQLDLFNKDEDHG